MAAGIAERIRSRLEPPRRSAGCGEGLERTSGPRAGRRRTAAAPAIIAGGRRIGSGNPAPSSHRSQQRTSQIPAAIRSLKAGTVHRLLPTADFRLPTAACPLPTAHCRLPNDACRPSAPSAVSHIGEPPVSGQREVKGSPLEISVCTLTHFIEVRFGDAHSGQMQRV
jgi:hypothetical protein